MPIARLDDRAVLAVSGADVRQFLDNLLSNDAPEEAGSPRFAALLTPQGKIIADAIVHGVADGFLLDVRTDVLPALTARLGLYRLRSRVEVAASPDRAVFAAWGTAAEDRPPDPRLGMLGARFVAAPEGVPIDATTDDYHRHRIALGVPEGGVDFPFNDTFPHEAGMDALRGVAFRKGCYVGQEVVSRMQHRGTARTRPVIVAATAESAILPSPGAAIVAGERTLGGLGSSIEGRGIGLARLDRVRAALADGLPLRAGAEEVLIALPAWATWGWPADPLPSAGPGGQGGEGAV